MEPIASGMTRALRLVSHLPLMIATLERVWEIMHDLCTTIETNADRCPPEVLAMGRVCGDYLRGVYRVEAMDEEEP